MDSESAVPPHLRKYIVEQDYAQYSARDQAIWRFVLTLTHSLLRETAHPAYAQGFAAAGISTERIPEIARMNERLDSAGFRVVCVDGFIPPRAFQGFQARGVLPIAADIRSAAHLTYTPAPDIIHEAAGHAPFLSHPEYARFLRRIGACSEHAFETPHDRAVYQAIYALSELKEDPASTQQQLAEAEAQLAALHAADAPVSEATRMARFYWWTVEYGLVGTPSEYRLYGAGLLSSIGEAHFCHDAQIAKRVLSATCTEVDYDITRAQPQLFVARDFEHLEQVLEEVAATLSYARGGAAALRCAAESDELATFTTDTGLQVAGKLCAAGPGWLELSGPCALARAGALLAEFPQRPARYLLPLGELENGTPLSELSLATLRSFTDAAGQLSLQTRAGCKLRGQLGELLVHDGRVLAALLHDPEISREGELWLRAREPYPVLFAQRVVTASPLLPDGYFPATAYRALRVPKPRTYAAAERGLIELHESASAVLNGLCGSAAVARLASMHDTLCQRFPEEWLLRWNLLETLIALGSGDDPLAANLEQELERLELHFARREPIATGLGFLRGRRAAATHGPSGGPEVRHSGAIPRTR